MSLRKTLRVTIEKEITIEFPDSMLRPEYLDKFKAGLADAESTEGVFKYGCRLAADMGCGSEQDRSYLTANTTKNVRVELKEGGSV